MCTANGHSFSHIQVTVTEAAVFSADEVPTRTLIEESLMIGAFEPGLWDAGQYPATPSQTAGDVGVYLSSSGHDTDIIYELTRNGTLSAEKVGWWWRGGGGGGLAGGTRRIHDASPPPSCHTTPLTLMHTIHPSALCFPRSTSPTSARLSPSDRLAFGTRSVRDVMLAPPIRRTSRDHVPKPRMPRSRSRTHSSRPTAMP